MHKETGIVRVLVTGFEPFGGESINPSWEVARQVGAHLSGMSEVDIACALLPVDPHAVRDQLERAIQESDPDLIVMLGQAGGRFQLAPERVGINLVTCADGDCLPHEEPIEPDGPAAYFTTLDLKLMVEAMHTAGVPAVISNSAGTYICNEVTYLVQHRNAAALRPVPAGFIHLPYLPEQVTQAHTVPSMALETMLTGVCAAIAALVGRTVPRLS
jgi:pyroglutamyl-peptidase